MDCGGAGRVQDLPLWGRQPHFDAGARAGRGLNVKARAKEFRAFLHPHQTIVTGGDLVADPFRRKKPLAIIPHADDHLLPAVNDGHLR